MCVLFLRSIKFRKVDCWIMKTDKVLRSYFYDWLNLHTHGDKNVGFSWMISSDLSDFYSQVNKNKTDVFINEMKQ